MGPTGGRLQLYVVQRKSNRQTWDTSMYSSYIAIRIHARSWISTPTTSSLSKKMILAKVLVTSQTFCNYDLKPRGPNTPMQQILSQSLNIGAAFIATKLGHERFRSYFTKLGFGEETGIDLPSEVAGNIQNIKKSPRDIEYDTASFGQGIAETPVQMIKALGALANDGAVVTPHLVRAKKLESGITKTLSWGKPEQVFTPKATEDTTRMLVQVVDVKLANGTLMIPEMSVAQLKRIFIFSKFY
jgi:cell division protein FtsI/penicillin-binding protein 2